MMPREWANARPVPIPSANLVTSERGSAPERSIRCFSDEPATYSMTMNGSPSTSPTSKTPTMFGWESCASARASLTKSFRSVASAAA